MDTSNVKYINGNCVLIPKSAVVDIGILDESLIILGDIDYGLRAIERVLNFIFQVKLLEYVRMTIYPGMRKKSVRIKHFNSPKDC